MPVCKKCGRPFDGTDEKPIEEPICNTCSANTGDDADSNETDSDKPLSASWQPAQKERIDKLKKELLKLKSQCSNFDFNAEGTIEVDQKRAFARHEIEIPFKFTYLRDTTIYKAKLLDISQGGIRFTTDREVESGQIIDAEIVPTSEDDRIKKVRNLVELKRVFTNSTGSYTAGGRFIKRSGVDRKDRRNYPRRKTETTVFYNRVKSALTCVGTINGISQGGFRFSCSEEIPVGELFTVRMRTKPPAFTAANISGEAAVVWVKGRDKGMWEAGCLFKKMNVSPIGEADKESEKKHGSSVDTGSKSGGNNENV